MSTPNGSNGNGRLLWWIMTGACTLVFVLASALANDMRSNIQHQAADISALQVSQAATAQALEDIRHDVHELLQRDRERHSGKE